MQCIVESESTHLTISLQLLHLILHFYAGEREGEMGHGEAEWGGSVVTNGVPMYGRMNKVCICSMYV